MKTQKWNEIHSGSKIILSTDKTMKGMNGEPRHLKAGKYYITGFWVDLCGLSYTLKGARDVVNDVCIRSTELVNFNNITK